MENKVKGIHNLMIELIIGIVGIIVTVISIIVTIISIRQNYKEDRNQKSNRSDKS